MSFAVLLAAGCGGDAPPADDAYDPAAPRVTIEPTTVVARHNESVTVRVDVPDVADSDLPAGYAFDLDEVLGQIDVTTEPCAPGAGSRACQDWTITPAGAAVPGQYEVNVRSVGSRVGTAAGFFRLVVVADPSPAHGAAVAVAASAEHVLVLNDAGRVFVRGLNSDAQSRAGYRRLPIASIPDSRSAVIEPFRVSEFVEAAPPTGGRWIALGAGFASSFAVRDDGTVWAWGYNNLGVLGFRPANDVNYQATPRRIEGLANVRAVAIGRDRQWAVLDDGTVAYWKANTPPTTRALCEEEGRNEHGVYTCVRWAADVRSLVAGPIAPEHHFTYSTVVIKNDGSAWQVGSSFNVFRFSRVPETVVSSAITTGEYSFIAAAVLVSADGSVWMRDFGMGGQAA
jgi:hypothetical protein